ncbi:MAG: transporter [Deltaproteobacteria bacterium]|nr:transporter [Deltaproteobacteria bacterium]
MILQIQKKGGIMDSIKKGLFEIVVLMMCIFLVSSNAFAARPLTTDDAGTVEKGKFQVEGGFDFTRQDNHDKEYFPSLTLTYGLFERMDIGIGSGYLFLHPVEGKKVNGLSDAPLKVKYRFFDQKDWIPSFAVSGTLVTPTASKSKGLGSGRADFNLNTIFAWNLSQRWQLYTNLGYTFIGEHRVKNEFNYSAAGQFVLTDQWTLVGEIFGVNNFNGHKRDDPISGLLGIQHCLISDKLILDAGVEIGMNKAAPDFRLTVGVTFFFKP